MKLGIYVGSFNPVHKGHIDIMNYLLSNNYVDMILAVPTLDYWHKRNLADIKDRINMLKIFENERIIIDTEHNEYIYTYDHSLRDCSKLNPRQNLNIKEIDNNDKSNDD